MLPSCACVPQNGNHWAVAKATAAPRREMLPEPLVWISCRVWLPRTWFELFSFFTPGQYYRKKPNNSENKKKQQLFRIGVRGWENIEKYPTTVMCNLQTGVRWSVGLGGMFLLRALQRDNFWAVEACWCCESLMQRWKLRCDARASSFAVVLRSVACFSQ